MLEDLNQIVECAHELRLLRRAVEHECSHCVKRQPVLKLITPRWREPRAAAGR